MSFTTKDIPHLAGKTAIVTGSTGGLGYETARALAAAGARVILAARNQDKGMAALARLRREQRHADVAFELVDLASLQSVKRFADRLLGASTPIDILVNNAAVMAPPTRRTTADGFELQFATNYLSHFALTAQLLPLLMTAPAARVVSLSSVAARQGRIDLADLQSERGYRPMVAYSQSKLACLLFAFELQRRSIANGWGITSIAAHPGVARTDLIPNGIGTGGPEAFVRRFLPFIFAPVDQAALPILLAATAPDARPGGYYGPRRMMEIRGPAGAAKVPPLANDAAVARQLWERSEALAGTPFAALAGVS